MSILYGIDTATTNFLAIFDAYVWLMSRQNGSPELSSSINHKHDELIGQWWKVSKCTNGGKTSSPLVRIVDSVHQRSCVRFGLCSLSLCFWLHWLYEYSSQRWLTCSVSAYAGATICLLPYCGLNEYVYRRQYTHIPFHANEQYKFVYRIVVGYVWYWRMCRFCVSGWIETVLFFHCYGIHAENSTFPNCFRMPCTKILELCIWSVPPPPPPSSPALVSPSPSLLRTKWARSRAKWCFRFLLSAKYYCQQQQNHINIEQHLFFVLTEEFDCGRIIRTLTPPT